MALSNWQLLVCGINHKTSSLAQRESLQIGRDEIAEANNDFSSLPEVRESAIVSTCTRIEFYFITDKKHLPLNTVGAFYDRFKKIDISNINECFYSKKNKHAANHLFRVAAGIDSMILGENQIISQLREAYSSACAVKASGKIIHRLFHQAFRVGKSVRTNTEMGKGACSISSAAVKLLKTKLKKTDHPAILFVGINQMIALAASNLHKLEFDQFTFANRTIEKAVSHADKYNSKGFSLNELPNLLINADVVITCTGSNYPIITKPMLENLTASRPNKKLIFMDMAIPRDVESEKDDYDNIEILDLEDVNWFVKDQQAIREQSIPRAEEIIEHKLDEFIYWYNHVCLEPAYNGYDNLFENIRRQEMEAILKELGPIEQDRVEKATKNLVNKLLQIKLKTNTESKTDR
jgi:glutamyl-tRNA reductase